MSRDMTAKGYVVVKQEEGRALKAYRDSVGVWTIGFGITNYDEFAVQYLGKKIGAGMTITDEQAEYLLHESIKRKYAPQVDKALGSEASDGAFDGGTSFHFNTGAIGKASWVGKFRRGESYRDSFLSWNKAGGKVLKGLDRRRHREYGMIHDGQYGNVGVLPATVTTNASGKETGGVATPASATQPTPAPVPSTPAAPAPQEHVGHAGMLQKGDTVPEVRDLQEHLLVPLGLLNASQVTGLFDDATDRAVRQFQIAHPQLGHDGVVGPATRVSLQRELDMKRKLTTSTASTVTPSVTSAITDYLSGGHIPLWAFAAAGAIVVGVAAFYAWKYRDEIRGWLGR